MPHGVVTTSDFRPSHERFAHLPAILLIALGFILGITASSNMSITVDELYHLTGGVTYWKTSDYRMHSENGNLPQLLAALDRKSVV